MKHLIMIAGMLAMSSVHAQDTNITFKAPAVYPEGIAANDSIFYVSSVKNGSIAAVNMNGNYRTVLWDATLKSSFGMKVDKKRNLLWVCTGDPTYSNYSDSATYKKMIHLIALDLTTGKKEKDIDLTNLYDGNHFANDLTLDNEGNIYITDSYSPVIYKVNTRFMPEVFARNDLFKGTEIGLNGIVWHPSGYLLTVNGSTGELLKINTSGKPTVSKVNINNFFPGGDGLLLDSNNDLILVQNKGINKLFKINSKDNFATAVITAATAATDRFQNPSTCTIHGGKVYALNSKMNEIQDPSYAPSKEFTIQQAIFRPVK